MMERVEEVIEVVEEVSEDRRIPRNVRAKIKEASEALKNEKETIKTRITTAITILDEASTDPNLQQFSRTEIWNVVSMLESLLRELEDEEL